MKEFPLISIIIPTYNSAKYIGRCMDSVLKQNYKQLEIIIVDDNSTDETVEICSAYRKKDSRISIYLSDKTGVSAARNKGIEKSKGKYIQFVDSDDSVKENITMELYKNIATSQSDIAICGYEYVGSKTELHHFNDCLMDMETMLTQYLSRSRYEGLFNYVWNKLYRSEVIKGNGVFFDESITLAEDAIFNMDVFQFCQKYCCISDVLYQHFDNDNSLEKQEKEIEDLHTTYMNICDKYKNIYRKNGLDKKYKELIGNKYLYYVIVLLDTVCKEKDKKTQNAYVNELLGSKPIMEMIKMADCQNANYKIVKLLLRMKCKRLILYFTKAKMKLRNR